MTETATRPTKGVGSRARGRALAPAESLGRYHVLHLIGSGGMGQVYAAYDPTLDRRVAIKLVHAHASAHHTERLTREARALAKLSHPNVVTVHEVAKHDGRVVIAMEYVEGCTLKSWTAEHPPDGSSARLIEALQLLLQAGRGLAAAHAADLVHRDFKPANVLVGQDGRARVADFGVSRDASVGPPSVNSIPEPIEAPPGSLRSSSDALTKTGTAVGTPAYMAPEQRYGEPVGAFSDQYSFCLTAWEVLNGKRPAISTLHDTKGRAATSIPSAIESALLRGLSDRPAKRHKHLDDLLVLMQGELDRLRGMRGSRRRALRLAGVAFSILAVGATAVLAADHLEQVQCASQGAAIETAWNADTRTAVESGLLATQTPYATSAAAGSVKWLDERAVSWAEAAALVCTHEQKGTWQPDDVGKANWCLDEARMGLVLLADALANADADVTRNATKASARLPSASDCVDLTTLQATPPAPSLAARLAATKLRIELANASRSTVFGRKQEAYDLIVPIRERTQQLGHPPLIADALSIEGHALRQLDKLTEARTQLESAYFVASRAGDWQLAAQIATQLTAVVGRLLGQPHEGEVWSRHASEAIARAGQRDGAAEARRRQALGLIATGMGNYGDSIDHLLASLELNRRHLGASHPDSLSVLGDVANAYGRMGDYEKCERFAAEAYEQLKRVLGEEHPDTARACLNYGTSLAAQSKNAQAKELFERALQSFRHSDGDTPSKAHIDLLNNLAVISRRAGDYADAREYYARSARLLDDSDGDTRELRAKLAINRGSLALHEEKYEAALRFAREGLKLRADVFGANHEQLIPVLNNIADAQLALDDANAAVQTCDRAFELIEAHEQQDTDGAVSYILLQAGEAHAQLGEYRIALGYLERAYVAVTSKQSRDLPDVALQLADVLWRAADSEGRDRPRARRLARQARIEFDAQGHEGAVADTDRWLADHTIESSP